MKKLIRSNHFFIAILLVIAYQYLSGLVLSSDFALGLSDFGYYLSDMMLHFLVVLFAFIIMIWSGKWQYGIFDVFFLSCDCRSHF